MKKILIAGKDSYVGTSFEKWVSQWPNDYKIDTLDTKGKWVDFSFQGYDVVYCVAGIAHVDAKKSMESLYYKVNRDLPIALAKKAKSDGVGQFIFMSSLIVYGDSTPPGKIEYITKDTVPKPANFYGNSKLQAEQGIIALQDDQFKVLVLRPPMIYGPGSKGNYPKLSKLAQTMPVFPKVNNKRSVLFIDNLTEFVRIAIDEGQSGIAFPQNKEYVSTSHLVRLIAKAHGKDIKIIPGLMPSIEFVASFNTMARKAFGSFVCDRALSGNQGKYCVKSLGRSIARTEYY